MPPTYGDTSFQRAVNAPDVSSVASAGRGVSFRTRGGDVNVNTSAKSDFSGFASMQRNGIVGQLQDRYMEQRGLRQNQNGTAAKPDEVKTPAEMARSGAPTHGNVAAVEKRAAATQLADQMVDGVTTGDMPGDTGKANTKKSRKKTNPNQTTLF